MCFGGYLGLVYGELGVKEGEVGVEGGWCDGEVG